MATYKPDPHNLFVSATKLNNLVETAASFSQDTSTHEWTVPAGKRWFLIAGSILRDANKTVIVHINDTTPSLIYRLSASAAATGRSGFPDDESEGAVGGHKAIPIALDAGEAIRVTFGGAQGAGAAISCMVLEVDV